MGLGDTREEPQSHRSGVPAGRAQGLARRGPETWTPELSPPTAPSATHCRMNWMASSYFIPLSRRASATRTGALGATAAGHPCVCFPSRTATAEPRAGASTAARQLPRPPSVLPSPTKGTGSKLSLTRVQFHSLLALLCDLGWARWTLCAGLSLRARHSAINPAQLVFPLQTWVVSGKPRLFGGVRVFVSGDRGGQPFPAPVQGQSCNHSRREWSQTSGRTSCKAGKSTSGNPLGKGREEVGSAPHPRVSRAEFPTLRGSLPSPQLTVPGRPRSARPRSCQGHRRTWPSAGLASPPPPCQGGVPRHQTASPAEGSSQ